MARTGRKPTSAPGPEWLAGFIDGEGCLRWDGSTVRIEINNTHRPTLNAIKAAWGGSVSKGYKQNSRSRTYFKWSVSGDDVVRVLEAVMPFLLEKREQAEIVLQVRSLTTKLSELKKVDYGV